MEDGSFQEQPLEVLQGVNRVNLGWIQEAECHRKGMDTKFDESRFEVEHNS